MTAFALAHISVFWPNGHVDQFSHGRFGLVSGSHRPFWPFLLPPGEIWVLLDSHLGIILARQPIQPEFSQLSADSIIFSRFCRKELIDAARMGQIAGYIQIILAILRCHCSLAHYSNGQRYCVCHRVWKPIFLLPLVIAQTRPTNTPAHLDIMQYRGEIRH